MRFLLSQITAFLYDYVDCESHQQNENYDTTGTLNRCQKVDFLAFESAQLGVVGAKKAQAIPEHQSKSINIFAKFLPPRHLLLLVLPLPNHLARNHGLQIQMNFIKLLLIRSFFPILVLRKAQLLQLNVTRRLCIGVLVQCTTIENRALFQQRFAICFFSNRLKFAGSKNIH